MAGLATFGFVAGTAVFVLSAVGFATAGVLRAGPTTRKFYVTIALAAGVLAVTYAATALGLGVRTVGTAGRTVYALRYVGWLVATPLVLVALWWLAGGDGRTLAALLGLDGLGVLLAGVAALTTLRIAGTTVRETRLALLGVAALLFVGVVVVVFRVLSSHAGRQPSEVGILFSILRNVLALLWVLYPVVWFAGTGLDLVGIGVWALGVALLDVTTVVGLGGILLHDDETLARAKPGGTRLGESVSKYRAKLLGRIRG